MQSEALVHCIRTNILTGVYFHLNGVNYSNNSIVNIIDIGHGDRDSLLCVTSNINCCAVSRRGEWYFPNMSMVRTQGEGGSFYRSRGQSMVRLHQRHNAMMPTGPFCCEIPDASNVTQRVCIVLKFAETDQHDLFVTTMTTTKTPGMYVCCFV